MEWALLSMHSTIEWTPPYPLCYALQLFLTVNSVNHEVGPLINALHPTQYDWVDSTLHPCAMPYNYSLRRSPFEWTPSYSVHVRLSGLHPTPCATPYNYSLQRTVSTMEWALLLMHPTLLCTIEWTPPYPLCYALQLFLTANSVNHGVGPLINALYPTQYDWVDSSTLPPVLRPTTIPYSEQCQPWSGPSY